MRLNSHVPPYQTSIKNSLSPKFMLEFASKEEENEEKLQECVTLQRELQERELQVSCSSALKPLLGEKVK